MPSESLNEREFELINIVGAKLGSNQRDLSRQMELSLGLVNMLLRRLISKGYIRINQLNKKKVEYLLTPKGFSEKMRKSVKYTIKTICSIGLIKKQLTAVLKELIEKGERKFVVIGESDFGVLVEMILKSLSNEKFHIRHSHDISKTHVDEYFLICKELSKNQMRLLEPKMLNLVEELAKDELILSLQVKD
jgi:DNA-binding MarR family transcriptional regulator